jgi:hypothetical protein
MRVYRPRDKRRVFTSHTPASRAYASNRRFVKHSLRIKGEIDQCERGGKAARLPVFRGERECEATRPILTNPSNRRNAPHPDLFPPQREGTKTETCTRFRIRILHPDRHVRCIGQLRRTDVPRPNPLPTNGRGNQIAACILRCFRAPCPREHCTSPSLASFLTRATSPRTRRGKYPETPSPFSLLKAQRAASRSSFPINARSTPLDGLLESPPPGARAKWRSRHFALEWYGRKVQGGALPPAAQA